MQRGTDREVRQRKRIGEDVEIEQDNLDLHISGEYELVEDRWLPTFFEVVGHGTDTPSWYARIELRDGIPELVDFGLKSLPGQRGIKQKDLRDASVAAAVEMLYPAFVLMVDQQAIGHSPEPVGTTGTDSAAYHATRRFVEQRRASAGKRRVTDELLRRVAEVYRENIDHAPTAAVGRIFGVKTRMASTYVQKARERGYLPKTQPGKKKA
ncbi:hypothetical protein [Nocardia sp. NPDC052566]|uniref:hypothetical protein n=1 Tax=Nocardia sp. NPDC052566 TaxID=3364330 RepID=UPI0037C5DC11